MVELRRNLTIPLLAKVEPPFPRYGKSDFGGPPDFLDFDWPFDWPLFVLLSVFCLVFVWSCKSWLKV